MSKKILIDAVYSGETRVVIYDQNNIQDFDYENSHKKQLKGNVYLAKVIRVEPSLQAAFVEYGGNRHGFLPFDEIHPNYFLKPEEKVSDVLIGDKIFSISLPEAQEEDVHHPVLEFVNVDGSIQTNPDDLTDEIISQEELIDEDEEEDLFDRHNSIHQKYKIQDVIKKGQVILIQVLKEERGNKGAACTSYISLAGRYCVFMPNSDRRGGISRRIINHGDRKYLKDVISNLGLPEGVSIILRTAGAGKNFNDIRRDYYYLARLWNAIREQAVKAKVNTFIHAESDLLKRTIRDLYSSEISEILIQGSIAYNSAKEFMKKIMPLHAQKIQEYKGKIPIFTKFNIENQISSLYSPIAQLPSGGYIVINPTEALIAIDVNSGKATTERNVEETATKTNVEAANEIARQLRLRDLSGLIVIDFIDMLENSNRRLVERTLRDAFQTDRAKIQLGNISAFGLLELSRQRLQSSFVEANTIQCPACTGKGTIKSFESNSLIILRTIESEIYSGDSEIINVYAHQDVVEYLFNHRKEELLKLENTHKVKIIFHRENTVFYDGFALEKVAKISSAANASPKLNDEDHMSVYTQDIFEERTVINEQQIGLGLDLAPYKVNDNSIINENAPMAARHKVHQGYSKKRKINSSPSQKRSDDTRDSSTKQNRKNRSRFKNKNFKEKTSVSKEKSVLKSWWEMITK